MRQLYEAKLIRIVNETTVDLSAELGLGVSTRVRLHLHGVETPTEETVSKIGNLTATDYIYDWFNGHDKVFFGTVLSDDEPSVYYGYVFADARMTACLNDALVDVGLLSAKSM